MLAVETNNGGLTEPPSDEHAGNVGAVALASSSSRCARTRAEEAADPRQDVPVLFMTGADIEDWPDDERMVCIQAMDYCVRRDPLGLIYYTLSNPEGGTDITYGAPDAGPVKGWLPRCPSFQDLLEKPAEPATTEIPETEENTTRDVVAEDVADSMNRFLESNPGADLTEMTPAHLIGDATEEDIASRGPANADDLSQISDSARAGSSKTQSAPSTIQK